MGTTIVLSAACGASDAATTADASTHPIATDAGASCPSLAVDRPALLDRARAFSARHGIETTIAFDGCPPNTRITCAAVRASDYASIVTFLDQVDAEMSRYPADFFTAIHLDYLVFGENLAWNDQEHDTLGGAVVPYGDHRSVLFISTSLTAYCYAPTNERTVHHEIAHAIDIGFAGVFEGTWWTTMNPPGFTYGGVDLRASDILDIAHPRPGLITKYAAFNVAEDYAEVYTALFAAEKQAALRDWLAQDPSLRAKFRSVVGALATKWKPFVEAMPNSAAIP